MSTFADISLRTRVTGPTQHVTRESIRAFAEASLDFNPLHIDDDYMHGDFGKTNFGGIIMHGMNSFGLITRMLTDWADRFGAIHRRLETRWLAPVKPGDTVRSSAVVMHKMTSQRSGWILLDVAMHNRRDDQVATGEALVEFPQPSA